VIQVAIEINRYSEVVDRKADGATYTPKILADFVAEQIVKSFKPISNDRTIRVLDPAVGDGELLISLLKKLVHIHPQIQVYGFDTNKKVLEIAFKRLSEEFPSLVFEFTNGDFLKFVNENFGEGDLFKDSEEPFDLIIANPPYVRTQVLGAEKSQEIAAQFGLSGRVDLYFAFILGMGRALHPNGVAGIIVSNRFMTTKSGKPIRKAIANLFDICHVWDLGDTKLFDAAVLPCVMLLKGKLNNNTTEKALFSSIYLTNELAAEENAENPIDALTKSGIVEINDGRRFIVQHGYLDNSGEIGGVWKLVNEESDNWLNIVKENTWATFSQIGKIRVGVKTTADKIFIRSDWNSMGEDQKPELLRPLITHHCAQRYKAKQTTKQILYPHEVVQGKRVASDLTKYPKAKLYLENHRSTLEGRKYVIEAGRKWYEIWVPQDPELWGQPKIVFRDIAEEPTFWIDFDGCIVNGDCYWLTPSDSANIDALWLALAIGNSKFIEKFYDHMFNNKLYAGRRRFITQYVEKFPLPNPDSEISKEIVKVTKQIYSLYPSPEATELEQILNQLVYTAFGLSFEEISR